MRLRNPANVDLSAAGVSPYFLEPKGPMKWAEMFGNENPVEVEIGCGKGLFLINAATQQPLRNYCGIEIARKYALFAASRVARRGLNNVRVARADAQQVLREWIPDQSVAVLHVYFPDPWWKRRHRKRRVFTESLVAHAARVLIDGGELRFASDVAEYFKVMHGLVSRHPSFREQPPPAAHEPEHDMDYLTNFDRKSRQAGKPVYRAAFVLQDAERSASDS
jgi:tRNA (guanine-N7-)-methyltransferase